MSINKVIIIGNLGKDPEIRQTKDGKEIANFSLATSESWKDKSTGEKKEKTEWHKISIFSQGLVNIVKQYVKKGSKLYIEGALQTRKWTDDSGVEKYSTEIVLKDYNSTLQILNSMEKEVDKHSTEKGNGYVPENNYFSQENIPF
jgi:single-strand DNA-binding protein